MKASGKTAQTSLIEFCPGSAFQDPQQPSCGCAATSTFSSRVFVRRRFLTVYPVFALGVGASQKDDAMPFQPLSLVWKDIHYFVPFPKSKDSPKDSPKAKCYSLLECNPKARGS